MTALTWLVAILFAGYGALVALMYFFQRRLLFFPDATRRDAGVGRVAAGRGSDAASADGETLIAWAVAPRGEQAGRPLFPG